MPTYSIDGPDGKTYSIDGPEGATREQVIAKIKERQDGAPTDEPSTLGDVAKSFGRGVAKGAIGLAGLPGDVARMVGRGVEAAGTAIGLPKPPPEAHNLPGMPPGSEQITKRVEDVAGKFGEPQTESGKAAQAVGEFVPSAFIGPGGPITRAVTTVAGGLGAYGGEKVGEQVGHPEAGRFIGGFAGGIGGGVAAAETAERRLAAALPGQAENYRASRQAYSMIQQAGVRIDPAATTQFVNDLQLALERQHFITRAGVGSPIFAALDRARDGDLAELMDLHSRLGKIKPNRGELYEAAVIARPEIRDFIENLQPPQLLAGNPQFVSTVWGHARDTWRTHAKLSEIEQASEMAEIRRASTGRGMNWNAFRQEFRKILQSDDRTRGYSPEAIEQLERVVRGSILQNAARVGSAMAPQRGVLGAAPAALAMATSGLEAGGAVAAIGEVSHFLEGYLTRRQIRQLEDIVRRESPIAPQQQRPNWQGIAPAAAARSSIAAGGDSPLASP